MKLGTLLLRNAAIGLSQLESALRNQVIYGGRLGTNLVELGFLDLEALSTYLGELTGLPVATASLLDEADKDLLTALGPDEAHRLRAIPLGFIGAGAETIAVAMVEPRDQAALTALAAKLGSAVSPYVVPELRALYYLERHFGTPRRARFVRTAQPQAPEAEPGEERRRQQPAGGIAMPPTFTLEPRRRRTVSQMPLGDDPVTLSYGAACEQIDTAADRDEIASVFVEYARGRCDALIVFLIREGNAMGWRSYLGPKCRITQTIDSLSLPLGGASALQAAHDTTSVFIGAPPSPAKPVETKLWAALGAEPPPAEIVVVPVLVKQRAVNLIYTHVLGGTPTRAYVIELTDLAARAQASYTRLIQQARGS